MLIIWHMLMYMPEKKPLPKEFQFNFNAQEVFIRKEGSEVILSPKPANWSSYLADGPVASEAFMEGVEDLPAQERKS